MDVVAEKKLMKQKQNREKTLRRIAFTTVVQSKLKACGEKPSNQWFCCGCFFDNEREIHKHVSSLHRDEIDASMKDIDKNKHTDTRWSKIKKLKTQCSQTVSSNEIAQRKQDYSFTKDEIHPWLPPALLRDDEPNIENACDTNIHVLLFYKYRNISDTSLVKAWQEELCHRLHLTGKIRVGTEGINGTIGGLKIATEQYITAFCNHPLFGDMSNEDFKESKGDLETFPDGLKVGIFDEIVPMGVSPEIVTYSNAGNHLSPEEFHKVLEENAVTKKDNNVFIDCRNFYESKIGKFTGAITPDIRKFSYWPEYVDKNKEFFKEKNIYMYCTGGIRCERGSAYIKSQGISQSVYQLKGGIHKYIEKYPDGYFRGKLFVFDNRVTIKSNEDIISTCVYCDTPWDEYQKCTSAHCHQLVLSCKRCRKSGHTACCQACQKLQNMSAEATPKEQCQCTQRREKIPLEHQVS